YRSPIARRWTRSSTSSSPGSASIRPRSLDPMRTLTDAQREAIADSGGRLRILACAGSETEVLAQRAVRLLMEGADPASIIAFTFTEKAAAELKARVESRAAEADQCFRELPPCGQIGRAHV